MPNFAVASDQHAYTILALPLKFDVPSITPVTFCSVTVLLSISQTDIPIDIGLLGTASSSREIQAMSCPHQKRSTTEHFYGDDSTHRTPNFDGRLRHLSPIHYDKREDQSFLIIFPQTIEIENCTGCPKKPNKSSQGRFLYQSPKSIQL